MSELLLIDTEGPIATLTLHRPRSRNAINDELRGALRAALDAVGKDPDVRVVVLTGADPAFCAGGDVRSMLERRAGAVAIAGWKRQQETFALTAALRNVPKITIAAVNGAAVGLGMDLALACDFIIASPSGFFAASFVKRGLIPDGGSLYYLPRRVGLQRTKDLIFSGRRVEAEEALAIGLVDQLSVGESALEAARHYGARFAHESETALVLMKSIVNRSLEMSPEAVAALGAQAQAICYTTDEHRESIERFLAR
jgi:enoyl-CoA hydratase/carnithine racemase